MVEESRRYGAINYGENEPQRNGGEVRWRPAVEEDLYDLKLGVIDLDVIGLDP